MRRGWRSTFLASGLLVLVAAFYGWLATTVAGASLLLTVLQWMSSSSTAEEIRGRAQAIAVLGGRTHRIDYAARLHFATGVPLFVIGKGRGPGEYAPESEQMEQILLRKYGVGPRWVENESRDTEENARFAWCLVSTMGIRRIALVTDTDHMPRARRRFEAAGFDVMPAPAPDGDPVPVVATWRDLVPSKAGRQAAYRPAREWLGLLLGPLDSLLFPPRPCPYVAEARPR